MLGALSKRLTYANVMATIAVFVTLGGGAYAASMLPNGSVGTEQLKNGAVTPAKVAASTISRIKAVQGNAARTDPVVIRWGTPVTDPPTGPIVRDAWAQCQANEYLVGGGANATGGSAIWNTYIVASNPSDGTIQGAPTNGAETTGGSWHVEANNQSQSAGDPQNVTLQAYALCAS